MITSTINDVVLVQLKALDQHTKQVSDQMTANSLSVSSNEVKMNAINQTHNDQVELMDQLSRKVDA